MKKLSQTSKGSRQRGITLVESLVSLVILALGVLGLLAVAALALGGLLWLSVTLSGGEYSQGYAVQTGWPYWLAIGGLWADAVVVAAFALWIASLSTVQMLPVALGALFAIAGKSLGAVLDYLERGAARHSIAV